MRFREDSFSSFCSSRDETTETTLCSSVRYIRLPSSNPARIENADDRLRFDYVYIISDSQSGWMDGPDPADSSFSTEANAVKMGGAMPWGWRVMNTQYVKTVGTRDISSGSSSY